MATISQMASPKRGGPVHGLGSAGERANLAQGLLADANAGIAAGLTLGDGLGGFQAGRISTSTTVFAGQQRPDFPNQRFVITTAVAL